MHRHNTRIKQQPGRFARILLLIPVPWIFVGLSVAYLGEAITLHQIVPVLLLPLAIAYLNRIVIPIEEERLHEVFGSAYKRYRRQVRRWI